MKKVSSWHGIDEFLAVVAHGGFTAAGDKLGVSKSYLSKTIRELEARLGVQLLVRTTRSLSLTGAGESFHSECLEMKDSLVSLENRMGLISREPVGRLRVALSGNFGSDYMTAYLADFSAQHPAIDIESIAYLNEKDISQDQFDIVIRYGELKDSNLRARKFGYLSYGLCASPDYIEEHGWPESADDIKRHTWLTDLSGAVNFNEQQNLKVTPFWMSNSAVALRSAVRRGLGLASLPMAVVRKDLMDGSILLLEEEWSYYDKACWVVYSPGILSAGARLFIDYLVSRTGRVKIRPSALSGLSRNR
ncbi:LysR family transcriptional regulator [Henriciella litoralis]|uniref:LysR family transcriptional regulator n=1 Tax=Henriciella litoralis TaxID=568102 RepID=UPI000A071D46|nr:LysR family transcriptional regulator [Henriciella litoralis]